MCGSSEHREASGTTGANGSTRGCLLGVWAVGLCVTTVYGGSERMTSGSPNSGPTGAATQVIDFSTTTGRAHIGASRRTASSISGALRRTISGGSGSTAPSRTSTAVNGRTRRLSPTTISAPFGETERAFSGPSVPWEPCSDTIPTPPALQSSVKPVHRREISAAALAWTSLETLAIVVNATPAASSTRSATRGSA